MTTLKLQHIEDLLAEALQPGFEGATTWLDGGSGPNVGYIVGVTGLSFDLPWAGLTSVELSTLELGVYYALTALSGGREFDTVGAWVNEGKLYIDMGVHEWTLANAIELGKCHNQLSVWDIFNKSEVKL